ncbi:phospholipase D-like domain-containing protein [Bradyrhizobium sp. AUGA SZCCT0431]|uniref:phospholipase D-like domain-containing protein n=1 Tax=Bradyrhizobium sp. AUGA SZCCT0431 TaxID=2807674 RepID=UPI001BAAA894|nr:phospholipase D-like domain-containing protein [Bradyrhizobium sp. AUGA SZCCT0431]MBR1148459.1 phospholipase [Bradyrhizobium sp. AUGA SZCCT0431]
MSSEDFQVTGTNKAALFTLKLHRGDGMCLVAMNWKKGKPPPDFVGFAIESKPPDQNKFFPLNNRVAFPTADGEVNPIQLSTLVSPIQKFRWVHFPRNANLAGDFTYRVTPIFMDDEDRLSQGEPQEAAIELRRETYPGQLNVTFTRGFVSSQAFVDRFDKFGPIKTLLPAKADQGLKFKPTHPQTEKALAWMGFEARETILDLLDQAIKDKADVRVVAYDLSEPEVVSRLEKIGKRLRIIIDDSKEHGETTSGESQAAKRLVKSAGKANVKRQHMKSLQHNKSIMVSGPTVKKVVFGSTNLSWRGLYVQANNALVVEGAKPVALAFAAFDNYFDNEKTFDDTASAEMVDLGLKNINAKVAFSPHSKANSLLDQIGKDIAGTTSCLFYSLAFLSITPGVIKESIKRVSKKTGIFVYGIADKKVGGIDLQMPNGNIAPVFAAALDKNIPAPFNKEPTGGGGNRMHHKFVVIDFDKPTARVYLGSYNFSIPADRKNGENLLLIRDRRVAVSYTIEALRIFDHYHFRIAQREAKKARKKLQLAKPPRHRGEKPWWDDDYTDPRKIRDRELFA